MSTQQDDASAQAQIKIPTPEELHDAIMGAIEPDLLSTNVGLLDEKYKDESTTDKEGRMARYKKAFTKYNAAFTQWVDELHAQSHAYKDNVKTKAVSQSKSEDDSAADAIASQFDLLDD